MLGEKCDLRRGGATERKGKGEWVDDLSGVLKKGGESWGQ